MEQRRRFKRVELAGMLTALAGLWMGDLSDQPLVQALALLPGLLLLGTACVLHLRLPREQRESVKLSWRFSPVHVYLSFLLLAVLELLLAAQLLRGEEDVRFFHMVEAGALVLFFAGEGMGYLCCFRRKKSGRKWHHTKKRREDPWN